MKITIELSETEDSHQEWSIWPEDNHVIIHDSKTGLLIEGTYSKHTVEFDENGQYTKTIFELIDIDRIRHRTEPFIERRQRR